MSNTFPWKLCHLWPNYKEYGTSRKARNINYLCINFLWCGIIIQWSSIPLATTCSHAAINFIIFMWFTWCLFKENRNVQSLYTNTFVLHLFPLLFLAPVLNLHPLIFGLMHFGWFTSNYVSIFLMGIFFIYTFSTHAHFSGTKPGCKTKKSWYISLLTVSTNIKFSTQIDY